MRKTTLIKQFKKIEWSLISVRFHGVPVFVKVRSLSDLEIRAIGSFSMIGSGSISSDWRKIVATAEIQNELVKASLVSPTYREIFSIVGIPDFNSEKRKKYEEIEKELITCPRGPLRKELETKCALLKVMFEAILPNDFCTDIVEYALGKNRSNIDKVTKDILLDCYFSYKQFGGRPSTYCNDETLTPFNLRDIDNNAMSVGIEWERARKNK